MKNTPFTWRDVTFTPERSLPGFWRSVAIPFGYGDLRTADWKVQRLDSGTWYARLRVGSDRFPGKGATAEAALESAAAEARLIMRFIRVMLPRAAKPVRKAVAR